MKTVVLNNGVKMPAIGFGVYQIHNPEVVGSCPPCYTEYQGVTKIS